MLVNFLQIDISLSQSAYDLEFESEERLVFTCHFRKDRDRIYFLSASM